MANIQSSTIKIYADSAKSTLVKSVNTSGSALTIPVDNLSEGTLYYATAQVVDEYSLTSAESPVYQFYTLPDLDFASVTPFSWVSSTGTLTVRLDEVTNDVSYSQFGMKYSINSDMSNATTIWLEEGSHAEFDITGLSEDTTYWFVPCLIDEFSRTYYCEDKITDYDTGYAVPTVSWTGIATVGQTTYTNNINITSTTNLTSVVLTCQDGNGTTITQNLSTTTGAQSVSLSGLSPNTAYTASVTATNSVGSATSSSVSFTTNAASISVALGLDSVDNSTNLVNMTSRITADNSITLVSHGIYIYDNSSHSGTAVTGETQSTPSATFSATNMAHLDPDETYWGFSKVEYTVSGDATTYTIWSSPIEIVTYALLSFGNITTGNDNASIPYTVSGSATSVTIEYSTDNSTWITATVPSLTSGTVSLSGLTTDTYYYLRGRCKSSAGWSGYTTSNFTTTAVASTVTITEIENITPTSADVTITVS